MSILTKIVYHILASDRLRPITGSPVETTTFYIQTESGLNLTTESGDRLVW